MVDIAKRGQESEASFSMFCRTNFINLFIWRVSDFVITWRTILHHSSIPKLWMRQKAYSYQGKGITLFKILKHITSADSELSRTKPLNLKNNNSLLWSRVSSYVEMRHKLCKKCDIKPVLFQTTCLTTIR